MFEDFDPFASFGQPIKGVLDPLNKEDSIFNGVNQSSDKDFENFVSDFSFFDKTVVDGDTFDSSASREMEAMESGNEHLKSLDSSGWVTSSPWPENGFENLNEEPRLDPIFCELHDAEVSFFQINLWLNA